MNKKKYIQRKKQMKRGNVIVSIGLVVLVIIFATTFLVYCQVNIIVRNVKRDLFYASNNVILSFDVQDLAYKKYTVNEYKTKEVIEYILNKNYTETEGSVTKIEVTDLEVMSEQDKVNLKVQVQVTFKSVINLSGRSERQFKMNESIKISLLDYE